MTKTTGKMILFAITTLIFGVFLAGLAVRADEGSGTVKMTFRVRGNGSVSLTGAGGREEVLSAGETSWSVERGTYVRLEASAQEETAISISVTGEGGVELEPASTGKGVSYIREITAADIDRTVDVVFGEEALPQKTWRSRAAYRAGASGEFPEKGDVFYGVCTIKSVIGGNGHTVHGVSVGGFTGILAGEGNAQTGCAQHSAAAPVAGMKYDYTYTVTSVDKTTGKVQGSIYARSQTQPADGSVDSEGYLTGYQAVAGVIVIQREYTGGLRVKKSSANTAMTADNACYSLKNAVYSIYSDSGCTQEIKELVVNADGVSPEVELPAGRYYIKEKTAPAGYALDKKVYTADVSAGGTEQVDVSDMPQSALIDILLEKKDDETGECSPQGAASLIDAHFEVKYFAGYYDSDPEEKGLKPVRKWVLKTDSSGGIRLNDSFKVSGDAFYKNSAGSNVLPLGTVTIQEIKAPAGYLLNNQVYIRKITAAGVEETVKTYQKLQVPQTVIRGDIRLVKFMEDFEDLDQKTPLKGIIFEITSQTTGETVEIITDENGYASTEQLGDERGGLVYDTYTVREKNTPDGLVQVKDFEVGIKEEGRTLYYILEDKRVLSPVMLVKTDSTTGRTIPVANIKFQLLDSEKEPITMTTYYPKKQVHEIFKTDEEGMFILPERLPAGKYYFREVEAPSGYILRKEDLEFTITDDYDWDSPLSVSFPNAPAMGKISVKKTDEETGEPLADAVFEITAAEAIVTPDGTVRAENGEVVSELKTDENGFAQSEELFLGTYYISEKSQPSGYVRDTKIWEVELTYKDQHTEIVKETIEAENSPVRMVIDKVETGTDRHLPGVAFEIWRKDGAIETSSLETDKKGTDPDAAQKMSVATDEDGKIVLERLEPGTYCFQEIRTIPGYTLDDTVHEFTVSEDGTIFGQKTGTVTVENDATEIIKTTVHNVDTGDQTALPGEVRAVDTVSMINLMPGTEYTLKGVLVDTATGKVLREKGSSTGEILTAETVFTADTSEMDVEVGFEFDASEFSGWTIAVFQYLYQDNTQISSHEELDNKLQQLKINGLQTTPEEGTSTPDTTPKLAPQTGDDRNIRFIAIAVFISGIMSSVLIIKRGKRFKKRKPGRRKSQK